MLKEKGSGEKSGALQRGKVKCVSGRVDFPVFQVFNVTAYDLGDIPGPVRRSPRLGVRANARSRAGGAESGLSLCSDLYIIVGIALTT